MSTGRRFPWFKIALLTVLLPIAAVAGLGLSTGGRAAVEAEVYKDRLRETNARYRDLAGRYTKVVKRSAVTELDVSSESIDVIFRTPHGEVRRVATPYRPGDEVYVDFALLDGRLMIRRVFENRTAPADGVVLDEALRELDWDGQGIVRGQAVSSVVTEGRWVVSTTGNGALDIALVGPLERSELVSAPLVEPGEPLEDQPLTDPESIGVFEVVRRLLF
ncbi:MAG: hypothetical protein AAF612_08615 [Planctomycetota bacterium]